MCRKALAALDAIEKATGEKKVNAVGYCVGGTLLAVTLAPWPAAATGASHRLPFLQARSDFTYSGNSSICRRATDRGIERRWPHTVISTAKSGELVNLMRSNDLIWPYVINNYFKERSR